MVVNAPVRYVVEASRTPELTSYLLTVPAVERLQVQGLWPGRWQGYRTVAGMVGVITAVLAGSAAALSAAVASDQSLAAALVAGAVVAVAALVGLMRYQRSAWDRASTAVLFSDE